MKYIHHTRLIRIKSYTKASTQNYILYYKKWIIMYKHIQSIQIPIKWNILSNNFTFLVVFYTFYGCDKTIFFRIECFVVKQRAISTSSKLISKFIFIAYLHIVCLSINPKRIIETNGLLNYAYSTIKVCTLELKTAFFDPRSVFGFRNLFFIYTFSKVQLQAPICKNFLCNICKSNVNVDTPLFRHIVKIVTILE